MPRRAPKPEPKNQPEFEVADTEHPDITSSLEFDGDQPIDAAAVDDGDINGPAIYRLPVLIVPQTMLMPTMSIPYPLSDRDPEDTALFQASRESSKMVFVLAVKAQAQANDDDFYLDIDDDDDFDPAGEQETPNPEDPTSFGSLIDSADLAQIGVIAEVSFPRTRTDRSPHVILHGKFRGRVEELIQRQPYTIATIAGIEDEETPPTLETKAVMEYVLEQVETYVKILPNVPSEVVEMVRSVTEPGQLADLIAFSPEFESGKRQEVLEIIAPVDRLKRVSAMLQERLEYISLRQQIQQEAQSGMDRQQREYLLREQLRTIQRELGEGSPEEQLAQEFYDKIEAAGMPEEVKTKALLQVSRLEHQHPFSPEIGVIRSYLEWLTDLPWAIETDDQLDLQHAAEILDADHYGLTKVKERILEFIAVRKLAGNRQKAPIICFVGPPGVGKTSLGKSIARALGRSYVRMSLGGVRDEAEIRGHRRTYVGAMPGRVIKALKDAQTRNPVLVLDEIDKVGSDAFRGDPSSALLEVLDPEQNSTFSDHYLEVPFDLSQVIFITTANLIDPIPPALRDRMEIIEVPGYTEVEKLEIAANFLLPKALESHGLEDAQLTIGRDALITLIREYTYESGVRNLDREIAALCRKVARKVADETEPPAHTISAENLADYLGIPRFEYGLAEEHDEIGVATGAAVTSAGGDLLSVETTVMRGKADLTLTGQLGEVMQESARAAISYARSRSEELGIADGYFDDHTIHIHVPAGATPKDGPSAGVTMATSIISAVTSRRVRRDVAMTGEITLRGKVLPVGGIREKALAAHRGGITTMLIPKRNEKDLADLPAIVREGMEIHLVSHMDEVLALALVNAPAPVKELAGVAD